MEIKSIYLVFVATLATFRPATCVMESKILEILEELRPRMCHPIPNLGLPALDPFSVRHKQFEMNNKFLIDFTSSVDNFTLLGLSDFVVNKLVIASVPLRRSTVNVSFPLTAFKSIYTAKGSLGYVLNLAGDGNAEASFERFNISISWVLRTGLKLAIRSLKIEISLGNIMVNFDNLTEEERINNFIHALINELGLELLNDIWEEEHETVQEIAEKYINDFIGQYTLQDILKLIAKERPPAFEGVPADCKDIELVLLP